MDLPYLRRDRQGELRDRLVEGLPVLVVGHSMSGKTRMALEVVRQLYGSWPVWIPERPDGVGELLAKGQPRNAVVWLDDLESFLTASKPCTAASLRMLQDAGCRVVATIRTSEYDKFQPTVRSGRHSWMPCSSSGWFVWTTFLPSRTESLMK